MKRAAVLILAAAVAACPDPVAPIKTAPIDFGRQASIANLTIYNLTSATAEQVSALHGSLTAELQRCATGPTRYDLVLRLERAQTGRSGPLVDGDIIAGSAIVYDLTTRQAVAQYHVEARTGSPASAVQLFSQRVCGAVFAN
jgi:hypothetical protein